MDDRALQQYAAMYKNDPYIFPLAFQESQNRQRLRMSQQSAQGMQPQPKVNEQALAQMAPQQLPEEMGIGALPADNMQQMADGGIAGYDDADFVSRSEPVVMMAGGGVARYQVGGLGGQSLNERAARQMQEKGSIYDPYYGAPEEERERMRQTAELQAATDRSNQSMAVTESNAQALAAAAQARVSELESNRDALTRQYGARQYEQALTKAKQAVTAATTRGSELVAQQAQTGQSMVAEATPAPRPIKGTTPEAGYTRGGFEGDPRLAIPLTQPVAPTGNRNAAPRPDTTRKPVVAASTAAPTTVTDPSAKPDTGGLDTLMAEYTRKQELAQGAARNADVQYASSLRGEGAKLVADEEKRIKDQVDPYKDREARLLKQEKGLEGMGDKYLGLALLQAGAAMMTTPGGIGMALGKGVQVGSERYIQGMEKINAAKDKFADARDRLDDLRLNRSDMNARDIKEARKEARTLERQAEALFYTGAREDLKMTNQGITDLFKAAADQLKTKDQQTFEATQTDKRIKSAEDIAREDRRSLEARASAPTPDMREAMLLGTGNTPEEKYLSGLKVKKDLLGDKQGTQLLKLFLEENGRREKNMEKPLTLDQFRRTSAAFYAPPAPVDTNKPTRP
jgi:hypothetical protein